MIFSMSGDWRDCGFPTPLEQAYTRTLWLQDHPGQAVDCAHQAVKDAASIDNPVTLSIVRIRAISLFVWISDLTTAGSFGSPRTPNPS
jgi:hypothetical protein